MGLLIAASVFVLAVIALVGAYFAALRMPGTLERLRLTRRIKELNQNEAVATVEDSIVKAMQAGPLPRLEKYMGQTTKGTALGRWIDQSGMKVSITGLLLMAFGAGGLCALSAIVIFRLWWTPLVGAAIGGSVPFLVLKMKRRSRLRKFEEQFPEALDLMARAVRAGHAFQTGIKMVADELAEPVGPEFRKTFDEQNFGLPLKDSLANLGERIPILDVRFFVTAVLIQRETGGNLSEILENLAHVVRERFKILRQVRVYTAHGRFTGYVLLGLPAALAVALMFINPEHMNLLFREPLGHKLLMATVVLQTVGYLWIQKVIKIEV